MTTTGTDLAEAERARHARTLRNASDYSRRADLVATERREDFYQALVAAHGRADEGKLTLDEIAAATGWSRGWIRIAIRNYKNRKTNTT